MSKIGKKPIELPAGVVVETQNGKVLVRGPKGELILDTPSNLIVETNDHFVLVKTQGATQANFGRVRSQLSNMVTGVSGEWKKTLEIIGTGYRAQTDGKTLTLSLGFSHPVVIQAPEGIEFQVVQNKVTIVGINKQVVGEIAAQIRKIRPPDSYKGKGIRYENEVVRKKPGKAAKGVGGTA